MNYQSKKSYVEEKSERSGDINEDYENIKDFTSSSKSKNSKYSSDVKLSEKRERSKGSTKISQKTYKEKKISESQKQFMEVNEMSETQIGREKEELKKEIESKQKRLNYLEIYEKIKNEMNKEIQKSLIEESKNNKFNNTKEEILKIIKKVTIIFYKKKEKSFNPQVKNMVKNDINNMLEQIKNDDEVNFETISKSQYFVNNSKNTEFSNINLDENIYLNNSSKSINKSENIKKSNKSKNEENNENIKNYKTNRSINSDGYNNRNNKRKEESDDEENNKTIVKNTYKNTKINKYSYKCLTNNLNFALQKGIKEGNFLIEIENNGLFPWPKNKTFLVNDRFKSNINIQNIQLDPLNPHQKTSVNIFLSHMNQYNPGKYNIHLDFMVNGKKYDESILINIEVTENINKIKHKTIIKAIRDEYYFTKSDFSDTVIGNAIEKYKNFEEAEVTLFENKFKCARK